MPDMGLCLCSAKWALGRPSGGWHTPFLECRNGRFKDRANIGAHGTRMQVQSPALKEWCETAAAQTIPCPFCWAQTETHTGHFNFKNPLYEIIKMPGMKIRNALVTKNSSYYIQSNA